MSPDLSLETGATSCFRGNRGSIESAVTTVVGLFPSAEAVRGNGAVSVYPEKVRTQHLAYRIPNAASRISRPPRPHCLPDSRGSVSRCRPLSATCLSLPKVSNQLPRRWLRGRSPPKSTGTIKEMMRVIYINRPLNAGQ